RQRIAARDWSDAVTILEALPQLGGMLRWGIPAYRLPRDVLDAEIDGMLELGIEVRCNQRFGTDVTLDGLRDEGFDAVFLGLGATESRRMRIDGEDLDGVLAGTEFLRDLGLGKTFDFAGQRVMVIGGGNTAIDAARTSLRLGAAEVRLVYRRGRAEMPAEEVEVRDAEEEGVHLQFLAAPTRLVGDGKLEAVEVVRMELGEPDAGGRRRPVPVEGSESTLPADICIAAIGQMPDVGPAADAGLSLTEWKTLAADERSLATAEAGVFAGGDCVHGAATVVEAVAHGREAARSIDRYRRGESVEREQPIFQIRQANWSDLDPADYEHVLRAPRQAHSCMEISERITSFAEVESGLSAEQAIEEAARCLECGCASTFDCTVRGYATEYGAEPERFAGEARKEEPDERHPLLRLEGQKCILCGACVRACDEVRDVRALGLVGRGFAARVRPAFGDSLLDAGCISCGACLDVCPTGAITERLGKEGGPFVLTNVDSACLGCGVGCALVRRTTLAGRHVAVGPRYAAPNEGPLCLRGHFGHRALDEGNRLAVPMVRTEGALTEATWAEAVDRAAALLREAGDEALTLVSPHATQEEVRTALALPGRTGSLDLAAEAPALAALDDLLGAVRSPRDAGAVGDADRILLVACDPMRSHPVAGARLNTARRAGARLAVLSAAETWADRYGDAVVRPAPGADAAALAGVLARLAGPEGASVAGLAEALAAATPEAVEQASGVAPAETADLADWLLAAERPLIVLDASLVGEGLARLAILLAATLGKDADVPLLALRGAANTEGAALLGVDPITSDAAEAARTIFCLRETPEAVPAGARLIVADCVRSPAADAAEVVLPLPGPHEQAGAILATGARSQTLDDGIRPAAGEDAAAVLECLRSACGAALPDAPAVPTPVLNADRPLALGDVLAPEPVGQASAPADTFTRAFRAWAERNALSRSTVSSVPM
ncbi:MAG: FAD-dependent oxidoreductase, partial [Planctomycetota bacterium]